MNPDKQHDGAEADRPRRLLPPLFRFLGLHLIMGIAIGTAFVSLIVLFNVGGLKELLVESNDGILALALLYIFNVFTFSSVSMGVAVMLIKTEE